LVDEKTVLYYESCNIYTITNAIETYISLGILSNVGKVIKILSNEKEFKKYITNLKLFEKSVFMQ